MYTILIEIIIKISFRPQQGLLIMNKRIKAVQLEPSEKGFRPQQGLLIMNNQKEEVKTN